MNLKREQLEILLLGLVQNDIKEHLSFEELETLNKAIDIINSRYDVTDLIDNINMITNYIVNHEENN